MSFPPYATYKNSNVTWLKQIPSHWHFSRVKHVCSFSTGWTPPTNDASSYDGNNLWANISDLGQRVITDTAKRISDAAVAKAGLSLVPKGHLLFSFKLSIGQVSFVGADMYTNEAIAAFHPSPQLDLGFAYYGFPIFLVENASENIYGAKLLNQELIKSAQIVLPPVPEQAAIAAFLDRETTKTDALVAEQQRLIELLKEKRQAVISHAVTKGLDPNAPMKDSGVEWLGEVPAHWRLERAKRLFRFVKRQDRADLPVLSVYRDFGVIEKSSRDDNINKTPEDLSLYQTVVPGDLVINKMKAWQGSLGVSTLRGITSPDYAVFSSEHSERPAFLNFMLRCKLLPPLYKAISNGIRPDQWRIEPDKFLGLIFVLPSPDEQRAIVEFLDRETAKIDALVAEGETSIGLLQERRSALISAAVTGKIDVQSLARQQAEAA